MWLIPYNIRAISNLLPDAKMAGMRFLSAFMLSLVLSLPCAAKTFPNQTGKVVEAKTTMDYDSKDCLWRVPCPALTVVIESPDTRYTVSHLLKKNQDASWLHAGSSVNFQYNEKATVSIQEAEKRWWIFGLVSKQRKE